MTSAAASPDLFDLVLHGAGDDLERSWNERMASPGPVSEFVPPLQILVETGRREFAREAGASLARALADKNRAGDAVGVLIRLAYWKIESVNGLEDVTSKALEAAFGSEDWFEYVLGKANLTRGQSVEWPAFLSLAECLGFTPGRVVEHRSGWGPGRVDAIHADADEVTIAFASGRKHTVPWQTAIDTMTALPEEDLRAMRLHHGVDALFEFAQAAPTEMLRRALRIYRGKANSTQIKEQLHESIVPAKSWTGWWKKAKAAAVEDPLIAVEGSASRPVLMLRTKALSLTDEARAQLKFEKSAQSIVGGLRAYFDRATRDSDRDALAAFATERLDSIARAANGIESAYAVIFLEEIGALSVEEATPLLRPLFGIPATGDYDPSKVELFVLADIEDSSIRSRLASQLPDVLGPKWVDAVLDQLALLSEHGDNVEDALETLVEALRGAEVPDRLMALYDKVNPFPHKHPFLIYALTKAYSEGAFEGAGRKADPNIICRVILHAMRIVCEQHTGRRHTRLQSRILTLLAGRKGILGDLLETIDRGTMSSAINSARAGGEDFPPKVMAQIEEVARRRFPDLYEEAEINFWDDDFDIFVTRAGFAHREAEFHNLRDVLIPANSKAIGEAASLGDLSENAEWEAAIEEQRTLTARASEWEEELQRARFLEEVEIPDEIVAPGTKTTILDLDSKETKSIRILGPWDAALADDVVSYRAPLAKGMLGSSVGDHVEIALPNGTLHLEIVEIDKLY
ncbi:MAG: GreA/GreB family elongation factor [Planctomycetes bacterium]|nr:GreA/GreB family elongation factor [Planctomycetota bacterium]